MDTSPTVENTKKISLIFFIIMGFIHLGTSMLIANDLYSKTSLIINKVADIPFVITGLIYGLASLRLSLADPSKEHKALDIFLICVIILVLACLITINILIPDLQS